MGGDQLTVKWIAASFHTGPPRIFPFLPLLILVSHPQSMRLQRIEKKVPPSASWRKEKSGKHHTAVKSTSPAAHKKISGGLLFLEHFPCSIDLAFFWREAGAWAIFRHFLLEETSSEWVQWCGHWKSYLTTNQRNGHADLASRWLCNTQNKFLFCKLHVWCWQHDDHCCHFLCWPVIYGHWATSRYNSLTFAPSFQVPPIGLWLEPSVPLPISWSVVNRSASP